MNSTIRCDRQLFLAALSTLFLAACGSGFPAGDPVHGKELFVECAGCHQLQENSTGPRLCGVIGRRAATVPGFDYSEAMMNSGLTWDEKTLDEFLTMPFAYVNGTRMGFPGYRNPQDRVDVMAYLRQVGADPALCP
jgi:cytochrome c